MDVNKFYEKEKKRMIIVVSHERQFYKLLIFNNIKSRLYESAFDLVENHFSDLENSVVIVDRGIEVPEGLEYIRAERNEIKILNDLLNKYEFEYEELEEKKQNALKTKAIKFDNK